jgi:hypothetical protein
MRSIDRKNSLLRPFSQDFAAFRKTGTTIVDLVSEFTSGRSN